MYINERPFLHVSKEQTRSYQLEVLKMLQDLDRVSQEDGLTYTLEAGSALGAVRHGGFIPWDNDSDVLMPLMDVKKFLLGLAKRGLFETYDIWYYHKSWGWLIKDIYLSKILKDPNNYCETSLDWCLSQITFAVFRLVRKDTVELNMSLTKGTDTYQVAHFDTSLSTASLGFHNMLPEEKRTWRRRYYREDDTYRVHPFIDIFPTIEIEPKKYIKMKVGFFIHDTLAVIGNFITHPRATWRKFDRNLLRLSHTAIAEKHSGSKTFEDYRVGVNVDYRRGIKRALAAGHSGETLVLSKAPWNLRKIIPYLKSELYPVARGKFEGVELNLPAKVVDILENHYRDFRTPPPEAERIQHAYHVDPTQFEQIVEVNV